MKVQNKYVRWITIAAVIILLVSNTAFAPAKGIQFKLPVVQLISPTGSIATNQPVFSWKTPSFFRASSYDLMLFMSGGSTWQESYSAYKLSWKNSVVSINPGLVLPAGTYAWKVRYRIWRDVYSDWSEPLAFTIPEQQEMEEIEPTPTVDLTPVTENPLEKATPQPTAVVTTAVPTMVVTTTPIPPTVTPVPPTATQKPPEPTNAIPQQPTTVPTQPPTATSIPTQVPTFTATSIPPTTQPENTPVIETSAPDPTQEPSPSVVATEMPDLPAIEEGYFDNLDPRLLYVGNWVSSNVTGTYQGTLHTSSVVGNEIRMTISGSWFVVLYSSNSNHGVMDILVDGTVVASLNQYSTQLTRQRAWESANLEAGIHSIVLRHSQGGVVDFDGLFVDPPRPDPIPQIPTATPVFTATPVSPAGMYYVATNGNDTNPGTIDRPWKSIQYAVNRLSAGNTLYVRGGTYYESVTVSNSSNSSQPIRIMAYAGETPVLDGNNYQLPSSSWGAMLKLGGSYIQVSGLEIRYSNWMAVILTGPNNTVSGLNVHHNKENGILIKGDYGVVENSNVWANCLSNENGSQARGGWASGLSAARSPNYAIIRNNTVYGNWGEGLSTYEANGTIIEGNTVYDNYSTNIYVSDATNVLVQRNIVYETDNPSVTSGSRVGIMMGDELYNPPSSNIKVINNIVYGAYRNFYWWQGTNGGGLNNVVIANNTFVNSRSNDNFRINCGDHQNTQIMNNLILQENSLSIATVCGSGLTFSNNLWSKTPPSIAMGANDIYADPKLTKSGSVYAGAWYQLQSTSPAIDKGVSVNGVNEDYFRSARSGTPDIGALEYR